ncbi:uncharacterized protein LOC100212263 isoform X1 [Hydra vulgaris]|uniref:uncharacterized protein LOC100212263 isoform X1 n=1 Tax=Hydra vulgaris TaxID=6087 RepID=UPI001F5ED6BF|nr:uncharacterized protein LOC100212263 isoform X1 [Hydra vulgaris]
MACTSDLKHLTSQEFVAGKPLDNQNKALQEFIQPHIESFNYILENGLNEAVKVADEVLVERSQEVSEHDAAIHSIVGSMHHKANSDLSHDDFQEKHISIYNSSELTNNVQENNLSILHETDVCLGKVPYINSSQSSTIVTSNDNIPLKDDNGDDIEFEACDEFENVELQVPSTQSKYRCTDCNLTYPTKSVLRKHLQTVHDKGSLPLQKATSRCIHPDCNEIFYHRQKMIDHLKDVHGVSCLQEDLVFNCWDEFILWKEKEEDANFVHFSKNSTHTNAKYYSLTNFTCQREGKAGYKYKGSHKKKYKDLVIGSKICPARMRARLDKPSGKVTVQYCKSHNHKMSFQDFLYRRMPDRLRNEIREKLLSGKSSEEVYKELKSLDNLREERGENFAPSKRQFVTLVNIRTIAKRMQIKEPAASKSCILDAEPYAIQVQKLLDETYNPVILFKDSGSPIEVGPEEIDQLSGALDLLLIGIQTKEQKEMLLKHGHRILLIDITDAIITPAHYIVTLKVLDEYNKGYPVAYLISNSRDETVLFYFFHQIKIQVADFKINAVMTENSCNEYYAFRSVFGDDVKHLLCKWNLHRAWCQKIHEECLGDEVLQQELYFIFLTILEEPNINKFHSIAAEFISNYQIRCPNFIAFFVSNYMSQPEVWTSCYRTTPESDCDELLYGDRIFDRVKKEMKLTNKPKVVDDILELVLKFEHEDYFNRGLNLMLNPPEQEEKSSEHVLGMKIKTTDVVDNYNSDNSWQVKTINYDPADLQTLKEETFVVTWKADVCDMDFCRERCLKLACFGLCSHLYHCSCERECITPCRHIHKVHSIRIGINQSNPEEDSTKNDSTSKVNTTHINLINTSSSVNDCKTNTSNQSKSAGPIKAQRVEKIKKIKLELVKLYKFLERENIQKYSLDFIEVGLKKVIDECTVIDSIGQNKEVDVNCKKRKIVEKDLSDFKAFVKHSKEKKVMRISSPVMVDIEPYTDFSNQSKKQISGHQKKRYNLTKSKSININIESEHSSNQELIVNSLQDQDQLNFFSVVYDDCNEVELSYLNLKSIKNISTVIINGPHSFPLAHLKALDPNQIENDTALLSKNIPNYHPGYMSEEIIDSYLYCLCNHENLLYIPTNQMHTLRSNQPYTQRFWQADKLKKCKYIFIPWKFIESDFYSMFIIDLCNKNIMYFNPNQAYIEFPQSIKTAHSILVGLMTIEIGFNDYLTAVWPLYQPRYTLESNIQFLNIRNLWYAKQVATGNSVDDSNAEMCQFVKIITWTLTEFCMKHIALDSIQACGKCKLPVGKNSLSCIRCKQSYHRLCVNLLNEDLLFVCLS